MSIALGFSFYSGLRFSFFRMPQASILSLLCLYLLYRARVRLRSTWAPLRFPPVFFFDHRLVPFTGHPFPSIAASWRPRVVVVDDDVLSVRCSIRECWRSAAVRSATGTLFSCMLFDWPSFNHLFQ